MKKLIQFFLLLSIFNLLPLGANDWVYISGKEPKLYQDPSLQAGIKSVQADCRGKILKEESGKVFVDCSGIQGWILKIHTSPVSSAEKPLKLSESDFKRQSITRSRARLNDITGTLASRGFLYSDKDSTSIIQSEREAESSLRWLEKTTSE
ncbi:MAG TPA: hypothetical protein PK153_17445 [Leptospiraceae bacterium]|nr:hypothetical protein [Leptospiraceae bacterium]